MYKGLSSYLEKYGCRNEKHTTSARISNVSLSYNQIKGKLLRIGNILEEHKDKNILVCSVKSGFLKMTSAVLVLKLNSNSVSILSYAKEGLIKQNISEKAIKKVRETING